MTKATLIPGQPAITRVVVEREATPDTIRLDMDRKTAEVLQLVTAKIGGKPENLRGEMDKIRKALKEAGVREYGANAGGSGFPRAELLDLTKRYMTDNSGIYFKE